MLQSSIHAHARSSAESSLSLSSHGEHGAREKDGASGAGQDTDDRDMCAGAGGVGSSGSGHRERGGDFDATLEQVQQENVSLRAKVETLQSTLKKVVQGVGRGQDGHSNPDGGALRFGVRACLCVCVCVCTQGLAGVDASARGAWKALGAWRCRYLHVSVCVCVFA